MLDLAALSVTTQLTLLFVHTLPALAQVPTMLGSGPHPERRRDASGSCQEAGRRQEAGRANHGIQGAGGVGAGHQAGDGDGVVASRNPERERETAFREAGLWVPAVPQNRGGVHVGRLRKSCGAGAEANASRGALG